MGYESDYFDQLGLTQDSELNDFKRIYERRLVELREFEAICDKGAAPIKVLYRQLAKEESDDVEHGKLIVFSFIKGEWTLYACRSNFNFSSPKPIEYFQITLHEQETIRFLEEFKSGSENFLDQMGYLKNIALLQDAFRKLVRQYDCITLAKAVQQKIQKLQLLYNQLNSEAALALYKKSP